MKQDKGASFTPGPWEYRELKDGWGIFPASVSRKSWSDDQVICGGEGDYDLLWLKEPDEANARLIAAAPELYEALETFANARVDAVTGMIILGNVGGPAAVNIAKRALAKARGPEER